MNCDCKDWEESWHQIESAFVMASIHGQQYTGVKFNFCPWCREELDNKSYGYTSIIISDGTTPIRKDCWMNEHSNSTVIPDTAWQVSKGGKYGLGDDYK